MILVSDADRRIVATFEDGQRAFALSAYPGPWRVYAHSGPMPPVVMGPGTSFQPQVVPEGATWLNQPESLYSYAGRRRFEMIEGGSVMVDLDGDGPMPSLPVPSDSYTRGMLAGAAVAAARDPKYAVRWKVGPGAYVDLGAEAITAISDDLVAFVQTMFDRNEAADAAIAAGTATTAAAVEAILKGG